MTKQSNAKMIAFGLTIGLAASSAVIVSGQTYTIADLGKTTWDYSEAHAMNTNGAVVGEYYDPNGSSSSSAFLFQNGKFTDLGYLSASGTPRAVAYGINDTSQIVGESDTTVTTHAFLYSNGKMTDLGAIGGPNGYSSAHAINRSGKIVGGSTLVDVNVFHAVLYSGASKTDLGALGGNYSSANAINSSSVIVGESDVVAQGVTNLHAFVYNNGAMTDLGTLDGGYSSAKGINDSGVIVGEATVGGTTNAHAFRYRNGTISDMGTLGGSASSASAINNFGLVVGYAADANDLLNAFLYDGSKMINLSNLIPPSSGWTNLTSADAINDLGQIAGSGLLADGSYHAFLLTPTSRLNVSITSPSTGASIPAPATILVSASASGWAAMVTNVQFLVNGSVIGNAGAEPYTATTGALSAGPYTLTAIASDNSGLKATNSINVTVTQPVSNTPPTVAITSPANNATFLAPATIVVGASASDPDGTVANVQFLVNGSVIGNSSGPVYTATTGALSAGPYTLTAVASDNAGLKATNSINVTVTQPVSNTPPTVAITSPANNATFQAPATIVVTASASDPGGSVANVQFLVNGSVIGFSSVAPYSATTGSLGAGNYTLSAVATDNAGLTATNGISISVMNVTLLPVTIRNPAFSGGSFSFSFSTQNGVNYSAERKDSSPGSANWVTFSSFSGNGSVMFVTDPIPARRSAFTASCNVSLDISLLRDEEHSCRATRRSHLRSAKLILLLFLVFVTQLVRKRTRKRTIVRVNNLWITVEQLSLEKTDAGSKKDPARQYAGSEYRFEI